MRVEGSEASGDSPYNFQPIADTKRPVPDLEWLRLLKEAEHLVTAEDLRHFCATGEVMPTSNRNGSGSDPCRSSIPDHPGSFPEELEGVTAFPQDGQVAAGSSSSCRPLQQASPTAATPPRGTPSSNVQDQGTIQQWRENSQRLMARIKDEERLQHAWLNLMTRASGPLCPSREDNADTPPRLWHSSSSSAPQSGTDKADSTSPPLTSPSRTASPLKPTAGKYPSLNTDSSGYCFVIDNFNREWSGSIDSDSDSRFDLCALSDDSARPTRRRTSCNSRSLLLSNTKRTTRFTSRSWASARHPTSSRRRTGSSLSPSPHAGGKPSPQRYTYSVGSPLPEVLELVMDHVPPRDLLRLRLTSRRLCQEASARLVVHFLCDEEGVHRTVYRAPYWPRKLAGVELGFFPDDIEEGYGTADKHDCDNAVFGERDDHTGYDGRDETTSKRGDDGDEIASWSDEVSVEDMVSYQFTIKLIRQQSSQDERGSGKTNREPTKAQEAPRYVLDIRTPVDGCDGCTTDIDIDHPRCTCLARSLRKLKRLPKVQFDMVRIWTTSDQPLADLTAEDHDILKAKTTVYIVKIAPRPDEWAYLPTSPIGGSAEVAVVMVVNPGATAELPTKAPQAYSEPHPGVTYRYLFVSGDPLYSAVPTTNNWPGAPVNTKYAFLDVFTMHLVQSLVTHPSQTYLVGTEGWPSDWMAAGNLHAEDWEQPYSVAVKRYIKQRMYPKLIKQYVARSLAGVGSSDGEEQRQAVEAATQSLDWMTWAEYEAWWQSQHGLPLSFILSH